MVFTGALKYRDSLRYVFGLILTQSFLEGVFCYESRIVHVFHSVSVLFELNNQSLKAINFSTPCFVIFWQSQSRA